MERRLLVFILSVLNTSGGLTEDMKISTMSSMTSTSTSTSSTTSATTTSTTASTYYSSPSLSNVDNTERSFSVREHTHKKKLLKSGHCPERGGGGFRACPNCLEHFLKIWAFLKKGGGVVGLPKLENLDF